ncbi:MAG: LamB/YcsF family protein [Balneolaceae bacterium]|nr:LamB/YcsF family protein [Balneolaceae bacterium]
MMKKQIDLNCDLGESYGKYASANDEVIMPYISSCNIACGFHSGDPVTITKTIALAIENGVAIGAHPSYPDLQGFGRRVMNMTPEELKACVVYQVSALKGMAEAQGAKLHHVKPHGALYNHASIDEASAIAFVEAIVEVSSDLLLYAPSRSKLSEVADNAGIKVCCEVFSDRSYDNNLRLRARSMEGAVLHQKEEVINQLKIMIEEGEVVTYEGLTLPIEADTVCLHSDTKGAEELAKEIHAFLKSIDVEITAP